MSFPSRNTDARPVATRLYFLPVRTRVPLKFGPETLYSVTCARVCLKVRDNRGREAEGWGETPLSVQWVWPSDLPYELRHQKLKDFCLQLAKAWANFEVKGHPLEGGYIFQQERLPELLKNFNRGVKRSERVPWLAGLLCCSAFDIALHDAYGQLHHLPVYQTYNARFMHYDLSHYLKPVRNSGVDFRGKYPEDFLVPNPPKKLPAWHLVGGLDPLSPEELTGDEPQDGYPLLLGDWIQRDGLKCLKIKLRGNDPEWDYNRIVRVGQIALQYEVHWLSADFNCTVTNPSYVNEILDRLLWEHPRIYGRILYVEQPFPYDLKKYRRDVHSVSSRKPLFMDESAHNWELIRLGRSLGWNGVALKTCKTQTGALLSLCWAKAHGMAIMVQDLTNPMLAQIPHILLSAYAGTLMGVETNAMQFYPEASLPEAAVHPGLYRRYEGQVDWSTLQGPGFGYRLEEIQRPLPEPVAEFGG